MATEHDLAIAVLQRLNIISEWQTASAQQINTCKELIARRHASLMTRGVIRWDIESIPVEAEDPFIDVLCYHLRNDYALPPEVKKALTQDYMPALKLLWAVNAIDYDGQTVKSMYY